MSRIMAFIDLKTFRKAEELAQEYEKLLQEFLQVPNRNEVIMKSINELKKLDKVI